MKMIKLSWFMFAQVSNNQAIRVDLNVALVALLVHILQVLFLHTFYLFKLAFIEILGWHIVVTEENLVVHIRRVELILFYNRFNPQYIEILYVESSSSLL